MEQSALYTKLAMPKKLCSPTYFTFNLNRIIIIFICEFTIFFQILLIILYVIYQKI
jgi:hypothetical protein